MEHLLILFLYIFYVLKRIGDGLRRLFKPVFHLFYISYKEIVAGIISIKIVLNKLIDKFKKSKRSSTEQNKKIYQLKTPKSGIFQNIKIKRVKTFVLVRQLPAFYSAGIKSAVKYILSKIIPHKITLFRRPKTVVTKKIKLFPKFRQILLKKLQPTIQKPLTIYPATLLLAWRIKWFFMGVVTTLILVLIPFTFINWLNALPNPQLLSNRDIEVTTKIYDRNGKLLYEIYSDKNRSPIKLNNIPLIVKNATIAIEDRSFYNHQGFSLKDIFRAIKETLINGHLQGGSTITQQLIKSALLTPEITLSRKIREIVLAFWAEQIYSKDQILEMYLNQIPYGGTAWGIESASQTYFGKPAAMLSLGEAALLAGLPAAPSKYSPFGSNPNAAYMRQEEVLRRMVEDHYISKADEKQALAENLIFNTPFVGINAPHFVMYIKDILIDQYGSRLTEKGGLRVKTTLDLDIQNMAQDIVRDHISQLEKLKVGNGAALITDPKTGQILSMVGSRDYFDTAHDGNVNVTLSLRQPGSSIKVVTYTAALENGFTAATIIEDSPVAYKIPGSPAYIPVNYDGKFHGPTPLRYALANSYNIPAVKTLAKIGIPAMIEKGREMGIESWQDESRYGLSITLGGADVTMLDIARVYGTLANQGVRADLNVFLEIKDYTGQNYEIYQKKSQINAVKPEVAFIISSILSDNKARSTAFGTGSSLEIKDKSVSVKTGTSNDKRDNWTVGYTPSYVVSVWVGNNDNEPMDPVLTSGVTGASPIWHDIMTQLTGSKADEPFPRPDNITEIPCYYGRNEFFITGTQPPNNRCIPIPTLTPTP